MQNMINNLDNLDKCRTSKMDNFNALINHRNEKDQFQPREILHNQKVQNKSK